MESFSPKLDIISENIIYALSINSKTPVSKIATMLQLSRRIAENKIKKLYYNGSIKPLLIYNYKGLIKATILLKLLKFDDRTIHIIMQLKQLVKLKETLGKYDLSLLIITEDKCELDKVLNKIDHLLHKNIQNMDVILHHSEDTLGYKSFCHNPNLLRNYEPLQYDENYHLSDQERDVISKLMLNPHLSYTELMRFTSLNYMQLKQALENLQNRKIIRFSIDPYYEKLGLEFHNALIRVNLAKAAVFEENMLKNQRVHWMKKGTGTWDYIISITARNISEFIEITREIRTQNKDIILDFSALISSIHVTRRI